MRVCIPSRIPRRTSSSDSHFVSWQSRSVSIHVMSGRGGISLRLCRASRNADYAQPVTWPDSQMNDGSKTLNAHQQLELARPCIEPVHLYQTTVRRWQSEQKSMTHRHAVQRTDNWNMTFGSNPTQKNTKMWLNLTQLNPIHGWTLTLPMSMSDLHRKSQLLSSIRQLSGEFLIFPAFITPGLWPPDSPDLNPVDYKIRGII